VHGAAERTLVIFTSDHARCWATTACCSRAAGSTRAGARAVDPVVAGPHPPGAAQRRAGGAGGPRADDPGGVRPADPERVQGRSLLPILTGGAELGGTGTTCAASTTVGSTRTPGAPRNLRGQLCHHDPRPAVQAGGLHGHPVGSCSISRRTPASSRISGRTRARRRPFDLLKRSFDDLAFRVDIGPKQVCATDPAAQDARGRLRVLRAELAAGTRRLGAEEGKAMRNGRDLSRRGFLAAGAAAVGLAGLGVPVPAAQAVKRDARETPARDAS